MTTDDRAEYIASLRQFANYLEARPAAPLPMTTFLAPMHVNAEVEKAAVGLHVADGLIYDGGNAKFVLWFGLIEYRVYGYFDFEAHKRQLRTADAERFAAEQGLALVPAGSAVAS